MNPNEIKKGLKCCINRNCTECPHNGMFCSESVAMEYALAYINRLEAKVQRLEGIINKDVLLVTPRSGKTEELRQSVILRAKEIKSEAIKEFAERLKESIKQSVEDAWHSDGNGFYDAECVLDDIDNLVKEMVGDEE